VSQLLDCVRCIVDTRTVHGGVLIASPDTQI